MCLSNPSKRTRQINHQSTALSAFKLNPFIGSQIGRNTSAVLCSSLTLFVCSVLHSVGPVAFVGEVGVRVVARGVHDTSFDVVSPALGLGPGVHDEVCGHVTENTCEQKGKP